MPSRAKTSQLLPMNSLFGKHAGETIFVIGTSASLELVDLELIRPYTKIGINRFIRRMAVEYLSLSEVDAFLALREEISQHLPHLLLYDVTAEYARQRNWLDGLTYSKCKMEYRDGRVMNRLGRPEDFLWEKIPPNHPYYDFYPNTLKSDKTCRRRIAEPGRIQHDGLFLRSNSNCVYATEWAYRMLRDGRGTPGRVILLGIDMRSGKSESGKPLTYIREINRLQKKDHSVRVPPPDLIIPHLGEAANVMAEDNIELISASPWDGPLDEFISREPLETLLA